jgi:ABC-2 type transport system permease protein
VRRVLLVTGREYRRMTGSPAFWIVSLIVPIFVLAAPVAQSFLGRSKTAGYMLVDKTGRYAEQIRRRLEIDYQRQVLVQLLMYAKEWRAGGGVADVPATPSTGASLNDAAVENFVAAGGAEAVLRQLKPKLLASAPPFEPPPRPLAEIPVPNGVDTSTPDRFGVSIRPHFREAANTTPESAGLAAAVYIPENVDSAGQVRVWTNGPAGAALVQNVKLELTQSLRLKALREAGLNPLSAAQIEGLSVPVSINPPEAAPPGGQAAAGSILPLVLAYLLLASMMITGSMMLQGFIEERSNKLLEAVLACVSPRELMAGKLVGISAIGLSIVGIWMCATVAIVKAEPSSPFGFLVPGLAALRQTPTIAAAMFFYFLAGYLTLGMIFLAVGVLSDSMQGAQAYLMPLTFVIAAPSAAIASMIYRDPNGLIPRIFSWIPIYTPQTMLARLQSGVSAFDLFGTSAMLLAFGAVELVLLGRLFDNNLIRTGSGFRFPGNRRRVVLAGLAAMLVAVAAAVRHGRAPARPDHPVAALRTRGEIVFQNKLRQMSRPGHWTRAEPWATGRFRV